MMSTCVRARVCGLVHASVALVVHPVCAHAFFSECTTVPFRVHLSVYFVVSYAPRCTMYTQVRWARQLTHTHTHTHTRTHRPPLRPLTIYHPTSSPTPTPFLGPDLYTRNPPADNGVDLFHIDHFPALPPFMVRSATPASPFVAPLRPRFAPLHTRSSMYTLLTRSALSPSHARSVFSTTEIRFFSNCPSTRRPS